MRVIGNTASNRAYNPKNRRPDLPVDSDEVDSAMERFIRKKYQEKSLIDGRPEPPSRLTVPTGPQELGPQSPQPPTASKKHRIFGFGFRASKKDKSDSSAAGQYNITPIDYSPTSGRTRELTDQDLQVKLAQLQEMGFADNEQNLDVLKRTTGDMEKTINTLTRLGPSTTSKNTSASRAPSQRLANTTAPAPSPLAGASNNPYQQRDLDSFEVSLNNAATSTPAPVPTQAQTPARRQTGPSSSSTNPWQAAMPPQQAPALDQQFSSMHVSQPLFPHNTGPTQTQFAPTIRSQTMTPPIPPTPQQYSYMTLPTPMQGSSNPFLSGSVSTQSTGSNPFMQQGGQFPSFTPSNNPFLPQSQVSPSYPSRSVSSPVATNPFDVSASQSVDQSQHYQHQGNIGPMYPFPPHMPVPQAPQAQPYLQPSQMSGFGYGQPQTNFPSYTQHPAVVSQSQPQRTQDVPSPYQQQPQQPLVPQQTGRYTKTDIMALFNAPPPQNLPLASIPEPQESHPHPQSTQQPISPAPNNPFGGSNVAGAKRSVTSPAAISNMYSSGGGGSRNPFLSNNTSRQPSTSSVSASIFPSQAQTQPPGIGPPHGVRHASNESMSVNNPTLAGGRHSPDAFANLSSGYR